MKLFLHPVPIACLLLTIVGAIVGNLPMMALALLAGVASLGILSAREAQTQRPEHYHQLSPDGLTLLRPVKKLVADIEELIQANPDSQTVRILGTEAVAESQRLLSEVIKSLVARDKLKKSLIGRYAAEKDIEAAKKKLESADGTERESLTVAVQARTLEVAHYVEMDKQIRLIDISVNQAEAGLAEMKARLSLSASGEKAALGEGEALREMIGRLQNLSASYEESARVIEGL
jgi:hypothetical protein